MRLLIAAQIAQAVANVLAFNTSFFITLIIIMLNVDKAKQNMPTQRLSEAKAYMGLEWQQTINAVKLIPFSMNIGTWWQIMK